MNNILIIRVEGDMRNDYVSTTCKFSFSGGVPSQI